MENLFFLKFEKFFNKERDYYNDYFKFRIDDLCLFESFPNERLDLIMLITISDLRSKLSYFDFVNLNDKYSFPAFTLKFYYYPKLNQELKNYLTTFMNFKEIIADILRISFDGNCGLKHELFIEPILYSIGNFKIQKFQLISDKLEIEYLKKISNILKKTENEFSYDLTKYPISIDWKKNVNNQFIFSLKLFTIPIMVANLNKFDKLLEYRLNNIKFAVSLLHYLKFENNIIAILQKKALEKL